MLKKKQVLKQIENRKKQLKGNMNIPIIMSLAMFGMISFILTTHKEIGSSQSSDLVLWLFFFVSVGFNYMFIKDRKKISKKMDLIYHISEKKTEEQLTKEWKNEAGIPLIKANSYEYFIPGQKEYNDMDATIYFKTEAEALLNGRFPK